MTTRWWAPEGPHIGPDERDFELLIPLDDSRHDLGAALLALHRVGAAACEEVALHAIPDEVSLVQALASARQAFAAPLVESVSKSIGEGPYAGLLVRDTIDDAESAALLVFRTLTSCGIPGQIAAQRAGFVYGVPEDGLGQYLAVAKELRAHPAALNDAADRALFSAIEKIASEESIDKAEIFEEVSKTTPEKPRVKAVPDLMPDEAPDLMPDDPTTDYYDARDTAGRFARGRKAGPPAVGDAPTKRSTRNVRNARSARNARSSRKAPEGRQVSQQRQVTGRDVSRLRKSRAERTPEQLREILGDDVPDMPTREWSEGNYMKRLPGPALAPHYDQLDHEVAIAMSTQEWGELQEHLGRDETGAKAFRMGYIAQEGGVEHFGQASDYERDAHRTKLGQIAAQAQAALRDTISYGDIVQPVSVTIDDDSIATMGPLQAREYITGQKFDKLVEYFVSSGMTQEEVYTPEVQKVILQIMEKLMPSNRTPDDKGDVYVYVPRMTGNSVTANIKVVELVFDAGVRALDTGHGIHTEYKFDPNQVMRIANTRPEVIYDPRIKAFRLRYHIDPSSDVAKADEYLDEHHVTNGPRGRFVATRQVPDLMPEEAPDLMPEDASPMTGRAARSSRSARSKRNARVTPRIQPRRIVGPARSATEGRQPAQGRKVDRARQVSVGRRIQRLQKKRTPAPKPYDPPVRGGVPELTDAEIYSVISQERLVKLMTRHSEATGNIGAPIRDTDVIMGLAGTVNDGTTAYDKIKSRNKREILKNLYGTQFKELQLKRGPLRLEPHTSEDAESMQILEYAEDLFLENPDVQQIQVDYNADGTTTFRGNAHSAPPVVLIQLQEDLDWKTPMVLKPLGRRPLQDFVVDTSNEEPAWTDIDEMRAIRGELESDPEFEWSYEDIPENTRVPIQLENPTVEHYMLMNYNPATDDSR